MITRAEVPRHDTWRDRVAPIGLPSPHLIAACEGQSLRSSNKLIDSLLSSPWHVYSNITNQLVWVGVPPFFRSFGIKDLGGGARQVFGFKGLAGKVFKNQRLRLPKSAQNGFGAVSRTVLVDWLETAPIRSLWSRAAGLKSMDFDQGWRTSPLKPKPGLSGPPAR